MNPRGREAEARAAAYLQSQGLRILARNWRCRFGELDLVAADAATIVFAEVRSRASRAFGGAAASIDYAKRRKLIAAANLFASARSAVLVSIQSTSANGAAASDLAIA